MFAMIFNTPSSAYNLPPSIKFDCPTFATQMGAMCHRDDDDDGGGGDGDGDNQELVSSLQQQMLTHVHLRTRGGRCPRTRG